MMNELITKANQAILDNPSTLVMPIVYTDETYWVKRRPYSKLKFWHRLQKGLSILIPIPFLKPTVSLGGAESLTYEAHCLTTAKALGLPVPDCVYVGKTYLITKQAGESLPAVLNQLNSDAEKHALIIHAFETLSRFHAAGLCHGRPAIKDMTVLSGQIILLDFEENPLRVMSLADAKARDIWLFLMSVAVFFKTDNRGLQNVFMRYVKEDPKTFEVLKRWVFWIKPVERLFRRLGIEYCGKDITKACMAIRLLENLLKVRL